MKQVRLVFIGFSLVAIGLASCGEKRLTPQEIEAKASEAFEAKKSALQEEATTSCTNLKQVEVARLRDSLLTVAEEEINAGKK
jgi:hypothetical protein